VTLRLPTRALLPALALLSWLAGCPAYQPAPPPSSFTAPTLAQPAPKPDAAEQSAAAQRAQQLRDQNLINQAESSYQSGVANLHANHLDAARRDFDAAVDVMLSSNLDLRADPALSDEFDRIVDAVNSLEMDALQRGNGFSPRVEASPLEDTATLTFPANPELTARLQQQLTTTRSDLPLVINDYVAGFINYFSNSQSGHAHLVRSLERLGRYHDMISKTLADEGVPQDLIYQAVAESGFQPQAMNPHSGAGGMWQFMPAGNYGLQRNGWFDERFDPEKSSRAYARYMKGLYNQFGDWYLAMAAYDWGPGNVQRAVQRTGYADFWELYKLNALPGETKNYVPGILAAVIMAKNPKQYGLDDVTPEPAVTSDTVTVDYALDIHLAADLVNSTVEQLVALNPALLRLSTPADIAYDLHLPAGTADLFQQRIQMVPEEHRSSWRFHVVATGESLDAIAATFHVKPRDLALTNQLDPADDLSPGDQLLIPVAPAAAPLHASRYTVRRGDTLITIADRFNVSVANLRQWNHLRSNVVTPGKPLLVAEPVHLAPAFRARSRRKGHASASTPTHPAHSGSPSHPPAATPHSAHSGAKPSAKPHAAPSGGHAAPRGPAAKPHAAPSGGATAHHPASKAPAPSPSRSGKKTAATKKSQQ